MPTVPTSPVPIRSRVLGSGTVLFVLPITSNAPHNNLLLDREILS